MTVVHIDFETYCDISVKDVGAWKYSEHPSCEVLCMAYAIDDREPEIWLPHMGPPQFLFDLIAAGATVAAHNAAFELAVWSNATDWPELPVSQLKCSLALAASFAFPMSLDKCAEALRLPVQKDKNGARLIRKFSTPRRPSKNNPSTRNLPEDFPEEFHDFCEYCRQDVRVERAITQSLPIQDLIPSEKEVWRFDMHMNRRGIRVDVKAVEHIKGLITEYAERLEDEAMRLTGGSTSSQRAAVLDWVKSRGVDLPDYTADTVREYAERADIPPEVRRVMQIRRALGKTSTSKYAKIAECACDDETVKGMVQYHGASTGRFAGRLVQVHNLPRGTVKNVHLIAPYLTSLTIDDMIMLFGDDVMEAISSLIRSMFIPSDGRKLFVSDFANIEGRVLAWMAGQEDLIAQFAANDDVYKHMAATIFNTNYAAVTGDQRFVGKQAVLGCGYGMGGDKFHTTCLGYGRDIGIELAKETVKIYREKNHRIRNSWYEVEAAAKEAILSPGTVTRTFMCEFAVQHGFLLIKLPSGRCLSYYQPKLHDGRITFMGVDTFTKKWMRVDTYGGKLVENIVQAVARDLLVAAMLRVSSAGYDVLRVSSAGYDVLTTIHDEVVAEGDPSMTIENFDELMSVVPAWAAGCPIGVEGWEGDRYRKG